MTQHLLGLRDMSAKQINHLLDQAVSFKKLFSRQIKQTPAFRGRTIAILFFEPSTRTRSSFEMACKLLGAGVMNLNIQTSSVKKGETLIDTVKNLEVLGIDALIVRHECGGVPHLIARNVKIPVINAGDGFNEHPTQGLLDLFTMREIKGELKDKKVTIVGDITHSRVARSNIWGLQKLGANVTVVGPPTLLPAGIERLNVRVANDLRDAVKDADFINVLRNQLERQQKGLLSTKREYNEFYGIKKEILKIAKPGVVIMHPGPINRGVEMDSDIVDGPHNVILDQVTNGIAVRMAVLYSLLSSS